MNVRTSSDLDFADDVAACEDNAMNLQQRMSDMLFKGDSISLHVSETKTKVMGIEGYCCEILKGRTCGDLDDGRDIEVIVHWKNGQYKGWLSSVCSEDSDCEYFQVFKLTHGFAPQLKICYDDGDVSFVKLSGNTGWLVDQDGDKHRFRRTGKMRKDGVSVLRNSGGDNICEICGTSFRSNRGLGMHKRQCKGNADSLSYTQLRTLDHSRSVASQLAKKLEVISSQLKISNGSNGFYEVVNGFQYLGSWISVDSRVTSEIKKRIQKAAVRFLSLKNIWTNASVSLRTKVHIFKAIVLSTLLYSSETWTVLENDIRQLEVFQLRCLRRICKLSFLTHTLNDDVLRRCNVDKIAQTLRVRRLSWMGHVWRMNELRLPRIFWNWDPSKGRNDAHRATGGQHLRYIDLITEDLSVLRLSVNEAIRAAQHKSRWKSCLRALSLEVDVLVKKANK